MVKLTQDMVLARSKTNDLDSVTKLNFWGSDLTDISIVRNFRRAEILSFSLNMINTLAPFQYCKNLQELYIRRNRIQDLRELCYLQELPKLKTLLLSENPCCETAGDLYRPTVIRALPNLELLDNIEVTTTDREYAVQLGLILEHPGQRRDKSFAAGTRYYENPLNDKSSTLYDEMLRQRNSSVDTAKDALGDNGCGKSPRPNTATSGYHPAGSPLHHQPSTTHQDLNRNYQSPGGHLLSNSPSCATPIPDFYRHQQDYDRQRSHNFQDIKLASNSYCHVPDAFPHFGMNQSSSSLSSAHHRRTSPRTNNNNKNLLSAVLCLINELDVDSLDLVDLALKKRQHELLM